MIKLGQKGRDVVTGFEGICLGKAQYLTGCNQAMIVPTTLAADGKRRDGEWFDEQRIQPVSEELLQLDNDATPGLDEAPPAVRS